jgi:hypothetical protein
MDKTSERNCLRQIFLPFNFEIDIYTLTEHFHVFRLEEDTVMEDNIQ